MKYKIIASYHNSKFSRQIFVSFIYIFFCFTTSLKSQSDAEYWINFAEKSCIYEQNYTVDLHTELYQIPLGAKISIKSKSMNSTALIDKSTDALQYNKKDGLRKVQINKIAVNGSNSIKQNSFILDISSMLKKMKNKAQWKLEKDHIDVDNHDCVKIISFGTEWAVYLWINRDNGTVLRYDQYLNNRHIGTSYLKYGPPINGKYIANETITQFHLTGHVFKQKYKEYSF